MLRPLFFDCVSSLTACVWGEWWSDVTLSRVPAGYVEDVVEGQTHQNHRADSLYDARAAETLTMNVVCAILSENHIY